MDEAAITRYIGTTLVDLQLVEAANPMFTPPTARQRRYRLRDHFMRFWFRFVLPYQQTLEAGLAPAIQYERNIEPFLDEHVSWAFEEACRAWALEQYQGTADSVGSWWGQARHDLGRIRARSSEEIDLGGAHRNRAIVIGEAMWTGQPMGIQVLRDLEQYKIPGARAEWVDAKSAERSFLAFGLCSRNSDREPSAKSEPQIAVGDHVADFGIKKIAHHGEASTPLGGWGETTFCRPESCSNSCSDPANQ